MPSMSSTLLCHLIPGKVLKILRDKDQSRGICDPHAQMLRRNVAAALDAMLMRCCLNEETIEAQCDWCGSPLSLTPEEVMSTDVHRCADIAKL